MTETVEDNQAKLAEALYESRNDAGLSLEAVAEKLNLSVERLSKFESSTLKLSDLNTFERGYLRNYARLLNVGIEEYQTEFPDGANVATNLHPIHRYSEHNSKPLMSSGSIKWFFIFCVIALIIWLLYSLGMDFSQTDVIKSIEQATEMTLPAPEE